MQAAMMTTLEKNGDLLGPPTIVVKRRLSRGLVLALIVIMFFAVLYMLMGYSTGGEENTRLRNTLVNLLRGHGHTSLSKEERLAYLEKIAAVERRQRERKEQMNKVCREIQPEHEKGYCYGDRDFTLVQERHKMLYNGIAKSGCTSWKRAMGITNGNITEEDIAKMSGNDRNTSHTFHTPSAAVHFGDFKKLAGLKTMKGMEAREVNYLIRTYYKFAFVRDPLVRLLSTFRAKFLIRTGYNLNNFMRVPGTYIYREFRGTPETDHKKMTITFEEYLRYIADMYDQGQGGSLNTHYNSLLSIKPCRIPYDFIGHLDTMLEDADYILQHVMGTNYSAAVLLDQKKSPHGGRSHGRETDDVFLEYYRNVSKPVLERICKHLDVESRMFGYPARIGWEP